MPLSERLRSWLARPRTPATVTVLAVLLVLPALWVGWQADDFWHQLVLRRHAFCRDLMPPPLLLFSVVDDPARTQRMMDAGWLPWWTYEGLRLSFCRPLTALTQWLDYQLWPESPLLMHAHSLAWFALLVGAAAALYRRLLAPAWVAGLAALFFAMDDAHAWPAAWLANRNGLTAAAFGVLAILAHERWRAQRWRAGAILGPFALLLGLLSGEVAVGTFGYLFAYALFLEGGSIRTRVLSLWPYVVTGATWSVIYRSLGFGAFGSSWYTDPTRNPADFVKCVFERAPILLLGQFGLPPPDVYLGLSSSAVPVYSVVAAIVVALLMVLIAPLIRRDRVARFWATGMGLALLPACATVPSDRLLLLAGLGAMGLIAQFIASVAAGNARGAIAPAKPVRARLARATAAILVLVHGIVAPLMLPVRAWSVTFSGLDRVAASLPRDPDLPRQHVILVNGPNAMFGGFLLTGLNALHGHPTPASTHTLSSGPGELEIIRTDARTLVLHPEGGLLARPGERLSPDGPSPPWIHLRHVLQLLDRLVRDDKHPMSPGQRIALTEMTIEVTALTPDRRPAEAKFRFDVPLEDASLRWLQWKDCGYVPFTPPSIGDTVRLPAPRMFLWTR